MIQDMQNVIEMFDKQNGTRLVCQPKEAWSKPKEAKMEKPFDSERRYRLLKLCEIYRNFE